MAEYRVEIDADTGAAVRNIDKLQTAISEVTKKFNDAQIGSGNFIREASNLSVLQKELKDARSAVLDIDGAYKKLSQSMAQFRSGMGAKGAIPDVASPIRGTAQQFGSPEYFDALNKNLEKAIAEGRQLDAEIAQAADSRQQAIANFRTGMGAKGASQVASSVQGTPQQFGSPAYFDALNKSLGRAIDEGRQLDAEIKRAAESREQAIMEFRSGMGAKGAIPAVASPVRGGIEYGPAYGSAGSPAYLEEIARAAKKAQQELDEAAKAAGTIAPPVKAFAPFSLASYEAKLKVLRKEARLISPDSTRWKELNKQILQAERGIENINKKQRLGPTGGQRLGAAGGAFLYGGGLGGGAGSALGGVAGGLAGGVPGAFTGAAVGQAVDNLTAMAGAMAEQAAAVRRLQSGLASASTSLQDYALASQEVDRISNRLLIPIDEATRKFTQLRASTVALGIDTKTTGELFEGTAAAVLRSGGSMDDVSGAMRAVVQVFSKGKLTAEELRGQLAERLPGAVVDFARISGKSLQQIDEEFEAGEATLDDFVKFLKSKKDDTSDYVDQMAKSSEFAGARMNKAFEKLRINIGNALQPTGAAIQDFATTSIAALDALIRKAIESKLIQPGPDFLESEALAGKQGGVAGLEERLLKTSELEGKLRKTADSMGLGFLIDFSRPLQTAAKEAKNLEEALASIRKKEDLTKTVAKQLQDEEQKAKKDQTAVGFLGAIERREESLAQVREQYEEEIAEARRDATKRAEELERKYKDNRITAEREIGRVRRELQAAAAEEGFLRRGLNAPATGERQSIIEAEREAASIVREYTEDKISREQEAQDREIQMARDLENFKKVNADVINKAGERYAKKVGEIQQAYARTVAKLIEDGSGNGAKRLAAAGKAIAAMIAKASAQQAFTAAAGTPIISRGQGAYDIAGETYTEADISEIIASQRKKTDPVQKAIGSSLEAYVAADKEAIASAKDLGAKLGLTATIKTPSIGSVSTADLDARVQDSASSLSAVNTGIDDANNKLSKQETIVNGLLGLFAQQAQASTQQTEELDKQFQQNLAQIDLIKDGVLPGLAQQQVQSESLYDLQRKQLSASEKGALGQAATITNTKDRATVEAAILKLYTDQLIAINENEKAYENFLGIARSAEAALEAEKIRANGQLIGGGMEAGFIGEAARAYEGAIEKGFNKEESSEIARATQEVKYLALASEGLEGAISNVGDSFGTAFKGIITGSMTAQEALAGMFQSIADSFADMVAKMIAEWLKAQLIKGFMSIFGGIFGGLGGGLSDLSAPVSINNPLGDLTGIGGQYQFANGGIAPGGFTAFANGGMVTGPTMGLVGEGRYNEAIVPLPDGKSIPVQLAGGDGGNQIVSNITVNVSNGQAQSNATGSNSSEMGRKIEGAVRQVIVGELRPGGLLASKK
jgi:tape measure domain-containing protein